MNLIDCIKSGKRFKRDGWTDWSHNNCFSYMLGHDDLLADDYEIEDPKPKRRLYLRDDGFIAAITPKTIESSSCKWTPLSRKEFEELFE